MAYLLLSAAVILNAVANILLKRGSEVAFPEGGLFAIAEAYWQAGLGILLFAANVIFYFLALRSLPISVAYPVMVAGGFLIINTYAAVFGHEHISGVQIVGYGLIFIGILLALGINKL